MRNTVVAVVLASTVLGAWLGCDGSNELGQGGNGFGGSTADVGGGTTPGTGAFGAGSGASGGAGPATSSTSNGTGGATGGGGAGGVGGASSNAASSNAASSVSSSTGSAIAPKVLATSPASGSTGVAKRSPIAVTFDQAMTPGSITASTSGTSCSGSLQVSKDGFATCVAMSGAPAASAGNTVFTVTPVADLGSVTKYDVRITTGAESAASQPLAQTFTAAAPFTVRYFHTIAIDGTNDFTANETFSTTSPAGAGYHGYLAWDDTYFYVGMNGADVASNDAKKWFVVYFGGAGGSSTGVVYNTQQPSLPFAAEYHVRWKASNDFTDALHYTSSWVEANFDFSGDVFQNGQYLEIRVPLSSLGSPTTLDVVTSMLNETDSTEATYAAVPSNAFASDGYDRDFGNYFHFDLHGSTYPALYVTSP